MKTTHQSEFLKIKSIFIKRTTDAFVSQSILDQQWAELNYLSEPNFAKAVNEYDSFEKHLTMNSPNVHYFPFDKRVTIDSVYCRDASIATDHGIILCNMGKSGRANEPAAQRAIFESSRMPILGKIESPGTLEGGDVAWLNQKTLAVGHSYRTNYEGIRQLKNLLEPQGVKIITVELPHYKGPSDVFHLMSILSPVDKDLAVVYSPLMPIQFRNQLKDLGFSFIEVPDDEFESMGCNVLALAPRKCLMVNGNPRTEAGLLKAGCEVINYDGTNISIPGGGGPTCLTRPLLRSY